MRQKNGIANEPPQPQPQPPNAWRILERKPANDKKPIESKPNNVDVSTNHRTNESAELVNLAHKVNIAERLKKQKENENKNQSKPIHTEEDLLKKMLGVGQPKQAPKNQLAAPIFPNNTQKVDLQSLFASANLNDTANSLPNPSNLPNPSSLPKPPSAWHQKPKHQEQPQFFPTAPPQPQQHQQQQNHMQNQMQLFQSQFVNNHAMGMVGPPLQHRGQFFPHPHMNIGPPQCAPMMPQFHQPQPHYMPQMFPPPDMFFPPNYPMHMAPGHQPFMQAPHHMPRMPPPPQFDGMQYGPPPVMHHSPEGPQKLKTKSGTTSAFIPLQAARKNVKGKFNSNNIQAASDVTKKDDDLDKPKEDESQHVQVNESYQYLSIRMGIHFHLTFQMANAQSNAKATAKTSPGKSNKTPESKPKDSKKDTAKENSKPPPKRLAANFSVPLNAK